MTRHHHALDRRTFVTGAFATGALVAAGSALCGCAAAGAGTGDDAAAGKAALDNLKADAKPAAPATAAANEGVYALLDFSDETEREFAERGLIAAPDTLEITGEDGKVVWSQKAYAFLDSADAPADAPDTANPSLWRNAQINHLFGLFEVVDGIYQVRGYDMTNITFVRGDTGWIVFDPLMSCECSRAAFQLVTDNLGERPIMGIVMSHPHVDHYGGIKGIVSEEEVAERSIPIIVPQGFAEHAVAENVYAGNAMGRRAGYAKFETFPVWNLPLKHPVNLAYEAATADLADVNMIDPFHLEAYGKTTVNYNRDVEAFPIVRNILSRISGENAPIYRSPTDMGVNMVGYAITDDEAVKHASGQEIIRRYFKALCDQKQGKGTVDAVDKIKRIMQEMGLSTHDRPVVAPALEKQKAAGVSATAIELPDGKIVTGKASNLMSASSSCVLNAIKALAGIDDSLMLISPIVLEPILKLKINILGSRSSVLKVDDVLAALAITAATNTMTARAMEQLPRLRDCEMHASCMLHSGDEGTLRKLGVRLTCEAEFPSKDLYF